MHALSPDIAQRLEEPLHWVQSGVPAVEFDDAVLTPWQIVLVGWVGAITLRGDQPASLPEATADLRFNALLVKMLEYSSVATAWRDHERAAS
ncbi:hypothetical protein [Curtobacterium ammoniigenes]|uniref:hypothetical protein n=1 Tax=Curtobacterium ammoniigenes TaxID=395387 RepID=UPI00082C03F7|nr:hypothetical protein [Curtobacterium ammoniigenes]